MARKGRKQNPLCPVVVPVKLPKVFRAGAYVRLSVEDSGKGTTDSIEGQKSIVLDYINAQPDMKLHDIYCDNGESGVTFDRPQFERLMADVKSSKVDCVVVKDLSRFGRNYIETGNYLESVFPFLNVRFVAITDSFDTLLAERSEDGYIIPLKNLINSIYAKDISQKVGSALAAKQKNGDFIGGLAAYGYRKDPKDKNHLLIDEEAAAVVQDIFHWYAEGITLTNIISKLIERGTLSPRVYHYALGVVKSEKYTKSKWNNKTLKDMLTHEIYLGHMVQGRIKESLFEGQSKRKLSKEEWTVVHNTHEPIITQELFDSVQSLLQKRNEQYRKRRENLAPAGETENLLGGLIFCDECGSALHRHKFVRVNKHAEPIYHRWYKYICSCHCVSPSQCAFTSIRETDVTQAVFLSLKAQIDSVFNIKELLAKLQNTSDFHHHRSSYQAKRCCLEQKLSGIARYRRGLFESYYAKVITEQEFLGLSESYENEAMELKRQLDFNTLEEDNNLEQFNPQGRWIAAFEEFGEEKELTREMVLALVEKITIVQDKTISITLKYRDEYHAIYRALEEQAVSACD